MNRQFIVAVAALLSSSSGWAMTNARYNIGPFIGSGSAIDSTIPITGYFAPTGIANTGTADITSLATYGVLKGGSALTTTGDGLIGIQNTDQASDDLTFQNSALNGQVGYLTARVYYNWTAGASASGSLGAASYNVTFGLSLGANGIGANQHANVACSFAGVCQSTNQPLLVRGSVVTSVPYQYVDGIFMFVFGQMTGLNFFLSEVVGGQSRAGGMSSSFVDAAHSIYWGGILGVTDGKGDAVDYSLVSASGTNYAQSFLPSAVPEPSSALLLFIGLIGLGAARYRKWPVSPRYRRLIASGE